MQERNPILARLTKHYFLRSAVGYFYDTQGRLIEERYYQSDEINNNPLANKRPIRHEDLRHCFRYHPDPPHALLWHGKRSAAEDADAMPLDCTQLTRTNSRQTEYTPLPDGRFVTLEIYPTDKVEPNHIDYNNKKLAGEWSAIGRVYLAEAVTARNGQRLAATSFTANARHRLTFTRTQGLGFGERDRTPMFTDDVLTGHDLDIHYNFPIDPVPLEVARKGLDDIYQYRRVRTTSGSRLGATIAEEFTAGSHLPHRRMWSNMNGIFREEFFDEQGRPTRTLNRGYFDQDAGYPENLRAYVEAGTLKVTPIADSYFGFRVYEYDASGRERLALVCWEYDTEEDKLFMPFPWWNGGQPKQFANRMERVNYYRFKVSKRCGPPDGSSFVVETGDIVEYMRKTYGWGSMKTSYYNR